ncbi:MAG TPA: hypothetical protein VK801_18660 [Caulobacteraceae bacterium]|jgi:hypothetical protein|nr:hypothetical protein [Caulobacteraceae bacterium]
MDAKASDFRRLLRPLLLGVAALAMAGAATGAHAQDQPGQPVTLTPPPDDSPRMELLVTPYLWLPWTSVGVRPVNTNLPGRSVTIGPGDLITHLNWVPFMGEAELRMGPFALVTDYMHAPVTSGITTRGILFGSGRSGASLNIGTGLILYRIVSTPNQYLDVGAGARAWGISTEVSLTQGLLPSVNVSSGQTWGDVVGAARYHYNLGHGFGATAYGDIGAGGARIDWQAVGTVDYQIPHWPTLHAGFRSLNFNYQAALARFPVNMYGPFIAATFHF